MKDRALFEDVLAEVEKREGAGAVEMWLKDVALVEADREEVVLAAPTQFAKARIEGRLAASIARAFEALIGARPAIRVRVDPSLVEAPHAPAAAAGGASGTAGAGAASGGGEAPAPPSRPAPAARDGLNQDMTLESFVVGTKNRLAFDAAVKVCESPGDRYNPLVITGGDGLGKTHLLTGMARRLRQAGGPARVVLVTGEEFANQFTQGIRSSDTQRFRERFRRADAVIIDDIGALATKQKTQLEFVHTFEELLHRQKQIVVSCEESPKRIGKLEPGLCGRLMAGLVVAIEPPELDARRRLVEALTARHHVQLSREVADFLVRNVTRSVGDMVGAVTRLKGRAAVGEKIDVPLVKRSVGDLCGPKTTAPPEDLLLEIVSERCGIAAAELRGGSTRRVVAGARQIAMFLMREVTKLSLTEIGRYFQREPSTVTHAHKKIAGEVVANDDVSRIVEECRVRFLDRR